MAQPAVHPASRVDDAWEAAYKGALTLASWEQAAWLLDTIGARMTTAAVGLNDARTVRRWRDDQTSPREHDVAARLAVLYRLARAISDVYRPSVATAFLRSANPQLDDTSPLLLLREGDPDVVQRPLLAAARAFLEG